MPVVTERKKLVEEVLHGSVATGVELARRVKADTVRDLLKAVWTPGKPPSVKLFDVCCDAISLKNRTDNREEVIR